MLECNFGLSVLILKLCVCVAAPAAGEAVFTDVLKMGKIILTKKDAPISNTPEGASVCASDVMETRLIIQPLGS